ncbi:MAG: hypothetical protein FWE22_06420 [Firmicutes bacterium]|nr:hypothetical protein [Bacillota bacterium]
MQHIIDSINYKYLRDAQGNVIKIYRLRQTGTNDLEEILVTEYDYDSFGKIPRRQYRWSRGLRGLRDGV